MAVVVKSMVAFKENACKDYSIGNVARVKNGESLNVREQSRIIVEHYLIIAA